MFPDPSVNNLKPANIMDVGLGSEPQGIPLCVCVCVCYVMCTII